MNRGWQNIVIANTIVNVFTALVCVYVLTTVVPAMREIAKLLSEMTPIVRTFSETRLYNYELREKDARTLGRD